MKNKITMNPKLIIATILLTAVSCSAVLTRSAKQSSFPVKLSPGIHAAESPTPLIYESYAALTFEFELPDLDSATAAFNYSCLDDRFTTNYSCPVYFHLQKLWDELRPLLQLQHLRQPSSDHNDLNIPSCTDINRHFHSATASIENLRKYKQVLRNCVNGILATSMVKRTNPEVTFSSQQLTRSFIENFYTVLPSNRRVDKALLVNMLAVADSLKVTQLVAEAQAWNEAVNQCRNGQLPSSKISQSLLRNVLGVLQRRLGDKELVIDVENDLQKYFSLPLSDCVLTSDDRLFIRTLVPLKSNGTEWTLKSLTSVPFVYSDGEDGTPLVCTVKDGNVLEGKVFAFEKNSKTSFPVTCDLKTDQICHNGDNDESILRFKRSCGSEILAENQAQILKLCELHCEPIETFRTPITLRVAPDTFYVVGKPEETVKVECGSTIHRLQPPKEGSLEVHVPCECSLMTPKGKALPSMEPCGRNLTVYTVKPMHLAGAAGASRVSEEIEIETDTRRSARL